MPRSKMHTILDNVSSLTSRGGAATYEFGGKNVFKCDCFSSVLISISCLYLVLLNTPKE